MVGVGWALLDSRFFVVRSVTVTGTHLVTGAEVRSAAAIPPGLPLIRVNSAMIAHRVEQIRQVQSAQVSRDWPDGVTIAVTERTPVLAVPSGGGYQLIDKYGVVVESSSRRPPALPSLELSAVPGSGPVSVPELRGSPAVYAAAVVLHELPRYLARSVVSVQAPSATEVTLRLARGITIVWGGTDRAAREEQGTRRADADACAHLQRERARDGGDRRLNGGREYQGQRRHAGPLRAWLVDPAPADPYCPYQSPG